MCSPMPDVSPEELMELPETFADDQPRIPSDATLKPQNLFHPPPVTQHYGFVDLADGMKHVEIAIDQSGTKLWVNVNGVCVCRVQNIEELVVADSRGDNETPSGDARLLDAE